MTPGKNHQGHEGENALVYTDPVGYTIGLAEIKNKTVQVRRSHEHGLTPHPYTPVKSFAAVRDQIIFTQENETPLPKVEEHRHTGANRAPYLTPPQRPSGTRSAYCTPGRRNRDASWTTGRWKTCSQAGPRPCPSCTGDHTPREKLLELTGGTSMIASHHREGAVVKTAVERED